MKNLRKLSAVVVLTFALALSAFAGETATPPCPDPAPGQTETPPCALQITFGGPDGTSTAPLAMGPPAVPNGTLFTRIAADVLLNFLPLF
jgi:hypothetical protein